MRSSVISSNGMVATSQHLSSSEAISILLKGGNAIDAAIAASAVQSVIEPNSTGIGGDCFALIAFNGKNPISINGSGIAAKKYNIEYFLEKKINKIELTSPHAVTIPGAVHAWHTMHQKYGKLDFNQLFISAENYARNGYPIHEKTAQSWSKNFTKLTSNEVTKKTFIKNNSPYKVGDIHKNINLANTLKSIGETGIKDFYEGYIAKDFVETLNKLGGLHSLEDFSKQNTIISESIHNSYKNNIIHQCPPNGPGITVLIMMAILEKFNFANINPMSAERFHLQAEVTKLAYELKESLIGDPNFVQNDLIKLLDNSFIESLSEKISLNKCYIPKKFSVTAHPETIYLTVVDRDLNAVSMINSICYAFGSAITTNHTGVLLQNRGVNFRLEEKHPNSINGHKRPLHTIIPGIITNNHNETILSYGVMGGQYQPVGQVQVLQNIFDFKMNIQESIDYPRAFLLNDKYSLEKRIPPKLLKELSQIGHNVDYTDEEHGGGQAIFIDRERGILIGGSDSRKDGCALGL